ncbi:MAG TPA: NAD-dependent epimerase/dehydratase family protein [Vicinamibacterales bacterium]|nr:NAD-dependent epimerase/dehydratase family protein [Vicinamibacterales bacterium]
MRTALVCGAGGFVGTHLVSRLRSEGVWVRGVDLKHPEFSVSDAHEFVIGDLRDPSVCAAVFDRAFDEVYHLAAEMGGAGYVFSGVHDAAIMANSSAIDAAVATAAARARVGTVFFPSSACVYPAALQADPLNPRTTEALAYPADPANEYGWQKLYSERLFTAHAKAGKFDLRIARFHTLYGPLGTWRGGREKAVAAICRKVAEADEGGVIEVWGDGQQTRSFLYIDEALEGVARLMRAPFSGPVNIGSEEMVTIRNLALTVAAVAGKRVTVKGVDGPVGVLARNSDNRLLRELTGWAPAMALRDGLDATYRWVAAQVQGVPS